MVRHKDSPPQVKQVYVNFLIHCYLETEVEVKEIHSRCPPPQKEG
jgi:hypothetical protein